MSVAVVAIIVVDYGSWMLLCATNENLSLVSEDAVLLLMEKSEKPTRLDLLDKLIDVVAKFEYINFTLL